MSLFDSLFFSYFLFPAFDKMVKIGAVSFGVIVYTFTLSVGVSVRILVFLIVFWSGFLGRVSASFTGFLLGLVA